MMVMMVVGLSLVPCCSRIATVFENKTLNTSACCTTESCDQEKKAVDQNDNEKGSCNSCSPFFACGSCTGFIFQSVISPYMVFSFPFEISYSTFNTQFDSEYFDNKWQPPKIS